MKKGASDSLARDSVTLSFSDDREAVEQGPGLPSVIVEDLRWCMITFSKAGTRRTVDVIQ
jgi:hypothetical protein